MSDFEEADQDLWKQRPDKEVMQEIEDLFDQLPDLISEEDWLCIFTDRKGFQRNQMLRMKAPHPVYDIPEPRRIKGISLDEEPPSYGPKRIRFERYTWDEKRRIVWYKEH